MDDIEKDPWEISKLTSPNHPSPATIPKQKVGAKALKFQAAWYKEYPCLHFCPIRGKVLCFDCAKACELGQALHFRHQEPAFSSTGFSNWKKAKQRMSGHARSEMHKHALLLKSEPVISQAVSSAEKREQETARASLLKIVTTIRFLARQGLALRGHTEDSGNFVQLLELRAADSPELQRWLKRKESFTSHDVQNEILELLSHEVIRDITTDVVGNRTEENSEADLKFFAVIVDGTQDVSGKEQESINLRFVDDELNVREEFVGFYEPRSTTGADLAAMIEDALCRLGLPLSHLRGMAFDGAANMAGMFNGAQAILRQKQPAALFVHCGAHCANLVAKESCDISETVRNALHVVNEVGKLFGESSRFRAKFDDICAGNEGAPIINVQKLRPLCPTRWTVRLSAVDAVLSRYAEVLQALEELASGGSHVAGRANGIRLQLLQGMTLVSIQMARTILAPLDRLNRRLQSATCTVSDLLQCVKMTKEAISNLRKAADEKIKGFLKMVETSGAALEPVALPRRRKPPARLTGDAAAHHPESVEEYLRMEYFAILDRTAVQLDERFDQPGVRDHEKIEGMLLCNFSRESITSRLSGSPWEGDFNAEDLAAQLAVVFRRQRPSHLAEAASILRSMDQNARELFPEVVKLVRLLMTLGLPASSATAERIFSALRRLKTWLRSTMTQRRVNAAAVCHVHRERLDLTDPNRVADIFASLNSSRQRMFGRSKRGLR